ncbi:sugar phosphate nucleotidyltransferase [Xanthovirga aplysinae]|uniref:sugar phosphate nucleotidyltransferase n=1 Tax=Xanthovirga aplysinae TaxID=2529853 RepID=UPI0012BBBFD9|nr:sugar phosphate nucleotidyltransferase [Xanthovirga aplysinae]MTI31184.1 glucose-1-phosphate cytidylyltransferase [Xanthovirga aplysinae]
MKVVLFCGGLGMRLRDYSEKIPKPMVKVGYRPILWNVMKYYAHYGHKEFILCLGYKGDMIKDYFVNYDEYLSNDFVYSEGGRDLRLLNKDIHDWKITFIHTGLNSNVGQRLLAVKPYLEGEEMFLANYTDGLSNLHLPDMIEEFKKEDTVAAFSAYQPKQSFHVVTFKEKNGVDRFTSIRNAGVWINTGYFIFRKEFFDYINEGEDLVEEPFQRLIQKEKLYAYKFKDFWACMDTFKDKQLLDKLHESENPPWECWNQRREKFPNRKKTTLY